MNDILISLQKQAAPLFDIWLTMQVQTGAFILIVFVIDSLLRNASPRMRYLLWMTALVKAFIPPVLTFPGGDAVSGLQRAALPVIEAGSGVLAANAPAGIPVFVLLIIVLLLCAAVPAAVVLFRSTLLRMHLKGAMPFVHDAWQEGPPVFVSRRISSPLAIGIRRPRIFITPGIASASRDILHAVLHHEHAHIRRPTAISTRTSSPSPTPAPVDDAGRF